MEKRAKRKFKLNQRHPEEIWMIRWGWGRRYPSSRVGIESAIRRKGKLGAFPTGARYVKVEEITGGQEDK